MEAAWRILLPYFKDVQDRAGCFREVWAVRRILTVNLPDAKERCAETALHAFLICTAVAALLLSVRRGFSDGPLSAGFRRRARFPAQVVYIIIGIRAGDWHEKKNML